MIVKALGYLALFAACGAFAMGYMLFFMEWLPALAGVARAVLRAARLLFLGIGWAVVIVRLIL